jgi:phage major head subunit gpT-like protein
MFIRTIFPDLFLTSMLPAIDEVVMGRYSQFPDQYSRFFRMESSSRWGEQTTEVTGFGQMAVVPEGKQTVYDEALPGFNKTYTHTQYSLGFKVSKIAMDDDRFGVVRKLASELGKSAKETKEVVCANVFNTGFSSATGPDGVALFSTAHPLIGGGTQTNKLSYATDPDVTSIRLALADMRKTVDHRGKKVRIPPRRMITPPDLEFVGVELLGGTERSDTANRAINSFKKRVGMPAFDTVDVWEYLTDPDAWFIQGDVQETELRHYNREAFNTVHDIDFDSRSVKTAGWMRFSVGYNGFYGVYGIPSS